MLSSFILPPTIVPKLEVLRGLTVWDLLSRGTSSCASAAPVSSILGELMASSRIGILGGGLAGCCAALALAKRGMRVDLFEAAPQLMQGASLHNEGKLHLGYVYAADPHFQTHSLMARGSLSFLPILEDITGTPARLFRRSNPFIYGIPADSLLSVEAISGHFRSVDSTISALFEERPELKGQDLIPRAAPLSSKRLAELFRSDAVRGAFQTGEYSLDTEQVAGVVSGCVRAHANIRAHTNHVVERAEPTVGGNYAIHTRCGTERHIYRYPFIVNCLWGDRLRLDESVGIRPSRAWLMRYKVAITLRRDRHDRLLRSIPSTTLILGPYGDVVNHGDGKVYVSWYPVCKLGETSGNDCDSLYATASKLNQELLIHESLGALSRYMPALESLMRGNISANVGGGVIFAWGSTDISDIESGLHQRYSIGPSVHDGWISLDTGKYCMAPLFGVQVADSIESSMK